MLRTLLAGLCLCVALSACAGLPGDVRADNGAVNTPIYNSNRLFFLSEDSNSTEAVVQTLLHPYEVSYRLRDKNHPLQDRRIENNEPVSIIVNSAYVPSGLGDNTCQSGRRFDWRRPDGPRDIAVLLDVSTNSANGPSFIAVWYQRGVIQDQVLNFDGLHVYSDAAWSATSPPHFRMRLVDVTEEQNARTLSLLDTIGTSGAQISALLGAPVQGPLVEVARQAASLVLSGQRNRAIIDYTFNAYSIAATEESGGMALTPFMSGGMMITGRPCPGRDDPDPMSAGEYWSQSYVWNQRSRRVYRTGSVDPEPMPFLVATVASVNITVPAIVAERSQRIVDILNQPLSDSADIEGLQTDANNLLRSLDAYAAIRAIQSNTQYAQLLSSVGKIADRWAPDKPAAETSNAPQTQPVSSGRNNEGEELWTEAERLYLINQLTQITGHQLESGMMYHAWVMGCRAVFIADPERGKFTIDSSSTLADETYDTRRGQTRSCQQPLEAAPADTGVSG